jgi:hypothetical protein
MKNRLSWILQVVVVGVVSSAVALWPYFLEFGRLLPGDSGDTLLNLWFLEHNLATIPLSPSNLFLDQPWFSPDFYFPVAGVRGWSDHLFLPTISYAFFKFLGFRPAHALLLWFALTLTLNYASLRVCLWKIDRKSWLVSAVCVLAAFNHVILAQLNHLQLLTLWFLPPLGLALFLKRKTWVVICLLLNWLVGPYIGVFALLIVVASYLISGRGLYRFKSKDFWLAWKHSLGNQQRLILASLLLLNFILILPYLHTSVVMGARGTDEITKNLPNVWAWLSGTGRQNLGLSTHPQATGTEPFLFPGMFLFTGSVASLFFWRKTNHSDRLLAKSLLFLGLSVTSFGIITLWWWPMLLVPSVRAVNAAGRIAACLWLLAAFPLSGLTLELENVFVRRLRLSRLFLAVCTIPLVWISLLPQSALALDVVAWQKDQDTFRTELLKEGCDVLHLDVNEAFPWHGDVFAMHAMLYVPGLKSVSGYSGWQPRNGWQPGMHARDAFSWALTNLGRNNYKAATSISATDTFCGVRAFVGDTGQVVYEMQKFSADEIQGQ